MRTCVCVCMCVRMRITCDTATLQPTRINRDVPRIFTDVLRILVKTTGSRSREHQVKMSSENSDWAMHDGKTMMTPIKLESMR